MKSRIMLLKPVISVLSLAYAALTCAYLAQVPTAQAQEAETTSMQIYIDPQEYTHSVRLWQFYADYWFMQGPAVEPVAKQVLASEFGNVGMCESNQAGNTLVWLKPSMFYNPHMTMYYGKITASVFSGSGKSLGTFVGESQKTGWLDVFPDKAVAVTYKLALQNLADKLKADPGVQAAIKNGIPADQVKTPCSMVTLLPIINRTAN